MFMLRNLRDDPARNRTVILLKSNRVSPQGVKLQSVNAGAEQDSTPIFKHYQCIDWSWRQCVLFYINLVFLCVFCVNVFICRCIKCRNGLEDGVSVPSQSLTFDSCLFINHNHDLFPTLIKSFKFPNPNYTLTIFHLLFLSGNSVCSDHPPDVSLIFPSFKLFLCLPTPSREISISLTSKC